MWLGHRGTDKTQFRQLAPRRRIVRMGSTNPGGVDWLTALISTPSNGRPSIEAGSLFTAAIVTAN